MQHVTGPPGLPDPVPGWSCSPPQGYRGQLEEAFQQERAARYASVAPEDCDWYHTTELPDGSVLEGEWDLRGNESLYLGETVVRGKNVLELGPASGHLTFWMEDRGASVTAFEAGYDAVINMVPPVNGADLDAAQEELMQHTRRTTNAWWFLHRIRGSSARLVHGNIYQLPEDLGRFDVTLLGCILLHTRDPFGILQGAAAHTDGTIVVVEPLHAGLEGTRDSLMQFGFDIANPGPSVGWWQLSPGAVSRMLWRLGFVTDRVVHHQQRYHPAGLRGGSGVRQQLFSLVAHRSSTEELAGARARFSATPEGLSSLGEELVAARGELERLRSTRTFRWSSGLRDLYGRACRLHGALRKH